MIFCDTSLEDNEKEIDIDTAIEAIKTLSYARAWFIISVIHGCTAPMWLIMPKTYWWMSLVFLIISVAEYLYARSLVAPFVRIARKISQSKEADNRV